MRRPRVAAMSTPLLGATEAELRRDRTSVKWVAYPPDVLPLWVAEMDAAPCPAVAAGRVGRGAARRHRLRLGPALRRRGRGATPTTAWGWEIDTSAAMIVPDVMIGAAELLRLLTDEGGPVVVSPPVYDSFFGFVDAIGRRRVDAPLDPGRAARPRGPAHGVPGGDRGGRAGGLPAVQPAEPDRDGALPRRAGRRWRRWPRSTGCGWSPTRSTRRSCTPAARVHALPHRARGRARLLGVLALEGVEPRRPEVGAGHGRAGLPSTTSPGCTRCNTHGSSHIGAIAHVAAMADGRDWLAQLVGELDANRALLGRLLAEHLPGVRWQAPEATYLAWLDCRDLGLGDDPARVFLERGRVALGSGPRYGREAGRGFARLNFATSPAILEDAVRRMASVALRSGAASAGRARRRRRRGAPRRRAWRRTARRRARGCGRWRWRRTGRRPRGSRACAARPRCRCAASNCRPASRTASMTDCGLRSASDGSTKLSVER